MSLVPASFVGLQVHQAEENPVSVQCFTRGTLGSKQELTPGFPLGSKQELTPGFPIGLRGGDLNLYRFVGNNPVNFIDPSGLAGEPWVYFDWGTFGSSIYDMGEALVTGKAGRAMGERAVQMVENRTGRDFTGTAGDYARFAQGLAGDMAGTTGIVEGLSGYDAATLEGLGGADRFSRGVGGAGSLGLSGLGGLGIMSKFPRTFPTAARIMGPGPAWAAPGEGGPGAKACPTASLTGGQARVAKFGHLWRKADLQKAIDRHAGPKASSWRTATGKTIYENPATGRQVVVDDAGYFRIFQPRSIGCPEGKYLDMLGKIPSPARRVKGGTIKNVPLTGDELNAATHFLIE